MQTLAALASDIIAQLVEYLSSKEIHSLLSSGDRILRQKIVNNVRRLELNPRHGQNFPFSALNLPQLDSIAVKCLSTSHLRFLSEEEKEFGLQERCYPRITSLLLHFSNSSSLFNRSLWKASLFPSLTSLDLRWSRRAGPIDSESFSELPKTLTFLKLSPSSYSAKPAQRFNINEIARLPRWLLSLHLVWDYVSDPTNCTSKEPAIAALFPPHLTSLSLCYLDTFPIMAHLPPSLEQLSLKHRETMAYETKTSLLLPKLTSLEHSQPLEFDSPLPTTLTRISGNSTSLRIVATLGAGDSAWKGLPLPPYLQPTFAPFIPLPSGAYRHFKRLESICINKEEDLEVIYETQEKGFLKSLSVACERFCFHKPVPNSVKTISMFTSMHGKSLQMLPRHLEVLTISSGRNFYATIPPAWELENIVQLPTHLRRLTIPFSAVHDGRKLTPISSLFLEAFYLSEVPSKGFKSAPNWLASCLPHYLKVFEIYGRASEKKSISTDCLSLCKLASVVPHLISLYISASFNNHTPTGPLFASLPSNLRFLNFAELSGLETSAISCLPRTLERINLVFKSTVEANSHLLHLCNDHFLGMPEQLCEISLTLPSDHAIDIEFVNNLPQTVCSCDIWRDTPLKEAVVAYFNARASAWSD